MTFDAALRSTFQSVLMSSPFRYLASNAHEDKVIADHAVASRLSFMLSGAPPDAQLLAWLVRKTENLKVLEAEADRCSQTRAVTAFHPPLCHAMARDGATDHLG